MSLKVVLYFTLGGEGWSEVYYTNDAGIQDFTGTQPDDFNATSKAGLLMDARKALLNKEATLTHVRVTSLDNPGQVSVYDPQDSVSHGTFDSGNAQDHDTAEIFSSLLITLEAGLVSRRRLYLGGIPEVNVKAPQAYRPVDRFRTRLQTFVELIASAPYVMITRPPKTDAFTSRLTMFVVNPDARSAIVGPIKRPVTDPQTWYVLIRGMKNPPGWNGVHLARSNDFPANTMLIGPTRRPKLALPAFVPGDIGSVQLASPSFKPLTAWNIVRIVSRRRGRPFGLPRGRR